MTKAIPAGAPRKRPIRSCVSCRSAKVRCLGASISPIEDVDNAEVPQKGCDRCTRQATQCVFPALRRKGRPRRLPKTDPAEPFPEERLVLEERDQLEKVRSDLFGHHGDATTGGPSSNSSSSYVDERTSASASPDQLSSAFEHRHLCSELCTSTVADDSSSDLSSRHSSSTSPASSLSNSTVPTWTTEDLARGYITDVHPFLSILPSSVPALVAYLEASTPLLYQALWSVVFPGTATAFAPPTLFGDSIADYQAAILSVYACYGMGDVAGAWAVLTPLGHRIVGKDWHRLDAVGAAYINPEERELIRAIFWAVWKVEAMLSVVTGVRTFVLQKVELDIEAPQDLEDHGSPFSLLLRATSLLLTCTAPPTTAPPSPAYLDSLTSLSKSLSTLSHHSYLSLLALITPSSPASPTLLAATEAAWMATIIASAATIFALSASFASSAFQCGLDITLHPPKERMPQVTEAVSSIFNALNVSLAPFLVPIAHSPFFGCGLLVAAHGSMLSAKNETGASLTLEGRKETLRETRHHLELCECALRFQERKWKCVGKVVAEVRMLKLELNALEWEGR